MTAAVAQDAAPKADLLTDERIAVIGLGYVGLPLGVALAGAHAHVTGFDISARRIEALKGGHDWTDEVEDDALAAAGLRFSSDAADLAGHSVYIVTVPTPIDGANRPDLGALESACATIGPHLSKDAIVVFESTVYPGVTEQVCGPLLEAASGLKAGEDFFLGYSPERINPGDKVHRIDTILKVVAGQTPEATRRLASLYGAVVKPGLHLAPTIMVAEAAKVIENTQRDINIALMNEIALIFARMGIRTADVLAAAGTKWNFLPFRPGLVGGHCIGVDPYYLTHAAQALGYNPEVILAGRRINDSMASEIAKRCVKMLAASGKPLGQCRVAVLGLAFKEDVPDLRNSKVADLVRELADYGIAPIVHDPVVDAAEARHEYGIELASELPHELDLMVMAVAHEAYRAAPDALIGLVRSGGAVVDVKSMFDATLASDRIYWSL